MIEYGWPDLLGNLGVAMIVLAYFGLQVGKLDGRALSYSVANALGAALVLVSLRYNFNLSSVIIEIFWLAISVAGIVLTIRRRIRSRQDD